LTVSGLLTARLTASGHFDFLSSGRPKRGVSSTIRLLGKSAKPSTRTRGSRGPAGSGVDRFDDRNDGGYPWSSLLAVQVDPVLAAKCDRPHRVLGQVVGEFQLDALAQFI
jgi:hypothetical protein